jgi:hypothetical protein
MDNRDDFDNDSQTSNQGNVVLLWDMLKVSVHYYLRILGKIPKIRGGLTSQDDRHRAHIEV